MTLTACRCGKSNRLKVTKCFSLRGGGPRPPWGQDVAGRVQFHSGPGGGGAPRNPEPELQGSGGGWSPRNPGPELQGSGGGWSPRKQTPSRMPVSKLGQAGGSRGKNRAPGSKCKMRCAYWRCTSSLDVKNVGKELRLSRANVKEAVCRALSKQCSVARFCSLRHMDMCKSRRRLTGRKRGPRDPLESKQVAHLIQTLCDLGRPWASVMNLCQVCMGERGTAVCKMRMKWLEGILDNDDRAPAIHIYKVNAKTTERTVPIPKQLANCLRHWLFVEPLQGGTATWPFPGQSRDAEALLFPGRDPKQNFSQSDSSL